MRTVITIIVACLVFGLLVYPWVMRSLNRARHASRIKQPGYGGTASGHFVGADSGSAHGKADGGGSAASEEPEHQ